MTIQRVPNDAYEVLPKLRQVRDDVLYGDIWERAELSKRDRSMITVAVLVASRSTEELRGHLARALDNGVTREELAEVITHVAFYAGWPTAVNAGRVFKDVLARYA